MDPHERATSVWYRVAGLLRRKDLAIEIVEAEIRSAQHEILLEPGRSASQRDVERAANGKGHDVLVPREQSRFTRCDYETVRQEDAWRKPPGFWGPWSAPPPEYIVERRVEDVTFAQARAYFADYEAALMPDFESPVP